MKQPQTKRNSPYSAPRGDAVEQTLDARTPTPVAPGEGTDTSDLPEPPEPEEFGPEPKGKSNNAFDGKLWSLSDLLEKESTEDWVFDGLFCRGDLVMLYGPAKCGKSFLALDMALAAASGQYWCNDRFPNYADRVVVYCAGEGLRGLRRRLHALLSSHGISDLHEPDIIIVPLVPQLFTPNAPNSAHQLVEAIRTYLPDAKPDLVIIDTLNRASIGANENSAQDMGIVLNSVSTIQGETGAAVVIIHHADKRGESMRGSSALRAAVDVALKVSLSAGGHKLVCDAIKDGEVFDPVPFDLTPLEDSVVVTWEGEPVARRAKTYTEIVLDYLKHSPDDWLTAKEIVEHTHIQKNRISEVLSVLEKKGLVESKAQHPLKKIPYNPKVFRARESVL